MKFVIFAVLSSLFLGGCTGGKEDSATDSAADSAAE
jgi:hypothetical protein